MKKNLFLKLFCFLLFSFFVVSNSYSQISEGGLPPSFLFDKQVGLRSKAMLIVDINFDVSKLKEEDEKNKEFNLPPRVGKIIPVNLTMENSGEWITLPNGLLTWQLTIKAEKALALSLYYRKFYIPKGRKLYIYNKSKTHVLGAYTENTNTFGKEFATELVEGDEITLEYVSPVNNTNDKADIQISGINYAYNNIKIHFTPTNQLKDFGDSGQCNVNINCSEGNNWQDQKRGVARILIPFDKESASWCTGSLINNTAQDYTPYFISAQHCFAGIKNPTYYNQIIFYFNYEQPNCDNYQFEPKTKTLVGATPLVESPYYGGSDGALLRINQNIPADLNVVYNGWDRQNIASERGVGIHHPKGDTKKISTFTEPTKTVTWVTQSSKGAPDAHWILAWSKTENGHGATEPGSSGSPLFNENGLLVGTLTGGNTDRCNVYGKSYYGKFPAHWKIPNLSDDKQMKVYLDPLNTGQLTLPYLSSKKEITANFTVNKNPILATETVIYSSTSFGAETYEWEFEGGTPSKASTKNVEVTYKNPGIYKVILTINKNKGADKERQKVVNNYILVKDKVRMCDDLITVGNGTSNSTYPLGAEFNQTLSASVYDPSEISKEPLKITNLSWYTSSEVTTLRTLYVYMKEVDSDNIADTWENEIADAELVYQSPDFWINTIGWNIIKLKKAFQYSGTKKLKILVRSQVQNTTGELKSSVCRSSNHSKKHMYWTSNSSSIPTTLGTVNDNRPDIRFHIQKDCSNPLKADFSVLRNIYYSEDFNKERIIPEGLSVLNKGASSNTWKVAIGDIMEKLYNTNMYSIFIDYDQSNIVDAWLLTKDIEVKNNVIVEFYLGYLGERLSGGKLTFFVSDNEGKTWDALYTTGDININSSWRWARPQIKLAENYFNKKLRFAWQYYGKDGYRIGLDDIVIYSDTDKPVTIWEGQELYINNISHGAPITWKWTLKGATNESDSDYSPFVKYMKEGTYDIELEVSNNLGSHKKEFKNAVTLQTNKPIAKFSLEDGYKRRQNNGRFIPRNTNILLKDNSLYAPNKWSWVLTGAEPFISSEKNVEAIYKTPGLYPVKLQVSNDKGESSIEIKEFINVGYVTDSIWNMPDGDLGNLIPVCDNGDYITGTIYQDYNRGCGEEFKAPLAPCEMNEVDIMFDVISGSGGYLEIKVYGTTSNTGLTLIAKTTVNVADIKKNAYTRVKFDEPVIIKSEFWVTVEGYENTTANVVVKSSDYLPNKVGTGRMLNNFLKDWFWSSHIAYLSKEVSLNISPILTYVFLDVDKKIIERKFNDNSIEVVNVNTNAQWEVSCPQTWISIDKYKSSFQVNCATNSYETRKGLITIRGGGFEKTILVIQDGVAPKNLSALIIDEENNKTQLKWDAYIQSEGFIDDFEKHPSFMINSPGKRGWTYIDDDSEPTLNLDLGFPGEGAPMAFINIYTGKGSPFYGFLEARSGTKCLASFAAKNGKNDDWIISPQLNFEDNFILSFWATSSPDLNDNTERIIVRYSTTGNDKDDFKYVLNKGDYINVPREWTQFDFVVPKDAKYVSINCVSKDGFILFIDDIAVFRGSLHNLEPDAAYTNVKSNAFNKTNFLNGKTIGKYNSQLKIDKSLIENTNKSSNIFNYKKYDLIPSIKKESVENKKIDDSSNTLISLAWTNNVMSGSIGLKNIPFEVAIKFSPKDLFSYHNTKLTYVDILPNSKGNYTLKIRQDNELVHNQKLTGLVYGKTNRIKLKDPIIVNASKELIIGYEITDYGEGMPATLDNQYGINGKGNILFADGKWYTLNDFDIDGNWIITAIVSKPLVDHYYQLYRNGFPIAQTKSIEYIDSGSTDFGTVCYSATNVHTGRESDQSNESCVYFRPILTFTANDIERAYGQPNPDLSNEYTIEGFLNGDNELIIKDKPSVSIDNKLYGANKEIGIYPNAVVINYSADDLNSKYKLQFNNGTLTIKDYGIFIPEIFTPNSDGINDFFKVEGLDISNRKVEFIAFDLSGEVCFQTKEFNNNWDGIANKGKYKGKLLPVGTYYYIIKLSESTKYTGFVVIKY